MRQQYTRITPWFMRFYLERKEKRRGINKDMKIQNRGHNPRDNIQLTVNEYLDQKGPVRYNLAIDNQIIEQIISLKY